MKAWIKVLQWDDIGVVLVMTLGSPLLVIVVWLLDMAEAQKYLFPFSAIKYVYCLLFQWWKEVLK